MLKENDVKRATLIEACINGKCTVKQVAIALGLSERRVKQIKKEVKENGLKSIQHGNRGRKPKNTIPDDLKKKIINLRSSYQYELSNFKHFQEILKERENIDISYSVSPIFSQLVNILQAICISAEFFSLFFLFTNNISLSSS